MNSRNTLGLAAQALTFGLTWVVASSLFGLLGDLWTGMVAGFTYFLVGLYFRSAAERPRDGRGRGHG